MRVQHNIMAMGAYRNYTNNVNAMKKNLERLSSGYKINRAGDDAAGLAISEKMRAQITGLETAQKNAKDGISLVQTAEGALTEVHDMLNRMVELATMSANGTYDNDTDRYQLQKEMDQLRDEINRIADSANFNGINLLNGDMDGEAVTTSISGTGGSVNGVVGGTLPAVANNPYDDLGVNTVLHQDVTANQDGSTFGINFHDFKFTNLQDDTLTIEIGEGDNAVTIELIVNSDAERDNDGTYTLEGQQIVNAILGGTDKDAGFTVKINGEEYKKGDTFEINGQEFLIDDDNSKAGGVLSFKQKNPPTDASEVVDASMKVRISGVQAPIKAEYTVNLTDDGTEDGTDLQWEDGDTLTIAGVTLTYNSGDWELDADNVLEDGGTLKVGNYEVSLDGSKLSLKAVEGGKDDKPKVTFEKAAVDTTVDTTNASANAVGAQAKWTGGSFGTGADDTTIITIYDGDKVAHTFTVVESANQEVNFNYNNKDYTIKYDGTNLGSGFTIEADDNGESDLVFSWASSADASKGNMVPDTSNGGKNGKDDVHASVDIDISDWISTDGKITGKLTIDDKDYTSLEDLDGAEITIGDNTYIASVDVANQTLTLSANEDDVTDETFVATDFAATTTDLVKYTPAGGSLKVTTDIKGADEKAIGDGGAFVGDYNVKTVNPNTVKVDDNKRLASTRFELSMAMVQEGAKIRIGDHTYVFTTEQDPDESKLKKGEEYMIYKEGDSLETIAEKFALAASNNGVYSVGVEDGTTITLVERTDYAVDKNGESTYGTEAAPKWDLRKASGIEASLGFNYADYSSTADAPGRGLTLQIGDTADSWNQLVVNIKDCHTDSLGIADISIADQDSAQAAVDAIKAAINYVSDVRGTLGATQNRLDHTINNLSVMTENIQDAESTIRDTDIAEEMMAYTKNNILIQSAQAMLAQANQVPQGVLQLLQ